jgi:hypothetical protein
MAELGDMRLLREYALRGSQEAFAALVERPVGLFFAFRTMGDLVIH